MSRDDTIQKLAPIISAFQVQGPIRSAEVIPTGHINDTYMLVLDDGGRECRRVLQRINHHIFRDPEGMMDNIERVLKHVWARHQAAGVADLDRRSLQLVPARNGAAFLRTAEDEYWRLYHAVSNARTYDVIRSTDMAWQAARAFGEFQRLLADLPAPRLVETIPSFHDTPKRWMALERAMKENKAGRAESCRREVEFACRNRDLVNRLEDARKSGEVPERVTHNDTKLNNVMMDLDTGKAICVIDLDTVMPGLTLYDFGDMVRSSARVGAEDEPDLSRVTFRLDLFEALTRGYLEEANGFLNAREKSLLAISAVVMTFEVGIRFLADYLDGDIYFKVHRPGHNLDRCRVQFHMVSEMLARLSDMDAIVQSAG